MQFRKTDHGYIIRLSKGEPIIKSLTDFCREQGISAGYLHGLGAALNTELGYYHLDRHEYEFTKIDELVEIVALNGNISLVDGKPFLHIHAIIADKDLQTYGGHLREATTGGTCEVYISAFADPLERTHDDEVGLKLLDL